MASENTSTVIGLFESRAAAEKAVGALMSKNYSRESISIVAGDPRTGAVDIPNLSPVDSPGSVDAGTGAAMGGLAGFVGGIIALAIPGIGPILAAGPLAAGIMGAGFGAAAGGLIGSLKEHGVPENDAAQISEALRRGRVLITAHTSRERADDAAEIMDDNGALDTEETEAPAYTGSETPIRPLTPEAVEAARLKPGESLFDRERERERPRRSRIFPGITGGMGNVGPNR
jgi:hypothetical protein